MNRSFASRLCLLAALCGCTPVVAQPSASPELSMSEALSGRAFPLTLTFGDLRDDPNGWRQAVASGGTNLNELLLSGGGLTSGLTSVLAYYTQGRTVRIEGTTFVVAYKRAASGEELEALASSARSDAPIAKLPADAVLRLTLINVATLRSLEGVRAFDASTVAAPLSEAQKQAIADEERARESESNLKQIGLALLQYAQDYDERLPLMNGATRAQLQTPDFALAYNANPRTVQERLLPYIKGKAVFSHPTTGEPYKPNGILSGRTLGQIPNTRAFVAFYEASPDASGKRAVLFLDGHVARINERDWPRYRAASRVTDEAVLPVPPRQGLSTRGRVVLLSGASALYYLYKARQTAGTTGTRGTLFLSRNGRLYYRDRTTGQFQYVSPPTKALIVPLEAATRFNVSRFQGYNNARTGQAFGGYGAGRNSYRDAVPITP